MYCRRKAKAPSTSIAASTVNNRNMRELAGEVSQRKVHNPRIGSERIASMDSWGVIFLRLQSFGGGALSSFHSRDANAVATIQQIAPTSGTSYRLPE